MRERNEKRLWKEQAVEAETLEGRRVSPSLRGGFPCKWSSVLGKGLSLSGMASGLHSHLHELTSIFKPLHRQAKFSGSIFPLPEAYEAIVQSTGPLEPEVVHLIAMMCAGLNSYYGVAGLTKPTQPRASAEALTAMAAYAKDVSSWSEKCEGLDWEDFLAVKSVDYHGEEVKVAQSFCWENIEPSLPDGIGKIPLEEVCELGTKDFVVSFEDYLLPVDSRIYTRPPRIMVSEGDWDEVCRGLLAKGVCGLLNSREVATVDDKPLFNGLFSVSKGEYSPKGLEIMRLIMNLVPTNKLIRSLGGDLSTLPSWAGMSPYLLEDNEVVLMSSEDIRCFFYLFSTPRSWWPYMTFGREVPASLWPKGKPGPFFLCSRVLPMGFAASVAIAQHVHRRIARLALHSPLLKMGPWSEIRKDLPFSSAPKLYRIYLDNFDILHRCDRGLASLVEGEASSELLALRESYAMHGLPRHPGKAVQQRTVAEIQGAIVDGVTGLVKPKPQKVLKYAELALQLLKRGDSTKKQMQIICGGFVYCCMFRRALLGSLNAVWSFITSFGNDPPVVRRALPLTVRLEIVRFICLLPFAQMNLRAPLKGAVTASDASGYGGGFCVSQGLTPMGCHAANCQVRGDLPELEDHVQVLTVGLFDGIGALRVSADCLSLPMAGHISSEVSREGTRVLESHFPDTESVGSVEGINEEMVRKWALTYSNVGVVLVGGGPRECLDLTQTERAL